MTDIETQLYFIQDIYAKGSINDDQRDIAKDMCFDEDPTFLRFFEDANPELRAEDRESLKTNIIKYIVEKDVGSKHLEGSRRTSVDSL